MLPMVTPFMLHQVLPLACLDALATHPVLSLSQCHPSRAPVPTLAAIFSTSEMDGLFFLYGPIQDCISGMVLSPARFMEHRPWWATTTIHCVGIQTIKGNANLAQMLKIYVQWKKKLQKTICINSEMKVHLRPIITFWRAAEKLSGMSRNTLNIVR